MAASRLFSVFPLQSTQFHLRHTLPRITAGAPAVQLDADVVDARLFLASASIQAVLNRPSFAHSLNSLSSWLLPCLCSVHWRRLRRTQWRCRACIHRKESAISPYPACLSGSVGAVVTQPVCHFHGTVWYRSCGRKPFRLGGINILRLWPYCGSAHG